MDDFCSVKKQNHEKIALLVSNLLTLHEFPPIHLLRFCDKTGISRKFCGLFSFFTRMTYCGFYLYKHMITRSFQ